MRGCGDRLSVGEKGRLQFLFTTPQQQEAARFAATMTFIRFNVRWQGQNAEAIEEMIKDHGVQILRTPHPIS